MQKEQVIRRLKSEQGEGSMRDLAKRIGCSAAYLSDVMRGNRMPGPRILGFLGLQKNARPPTYETAAQ